MSHPIIFFLQMQNTIKLYHWMTTTYSRHVAADTLYNSLVSLADKFIETYIGKYQRPKGLSKKDLTMSLALHTDANIYECLDHIERYLTKDVLKYVSQDRDPDLINIRDDILTEITQARYLFTLK